MAELYLMSDNLGICDTAQRSAKTALHLIVGICAGFGCRQLGSESLFVLPATFTRAAGSLASTVLASLHAQVVAAMMEIVPSMT